LRHMIVARKTKVPPRKKKKEKASFFLKVPKGPGEAAFEKPPAQPAIKPEKLEPEKEKLQMEELEKKLEEILKE
ncbi:MAG: hypothetical protein Q8L57_02860, partial [bacterium]|nr:hypothetical protein [bacterium]